MSAKERCAGYAQQHSGEFKGLDYFTMRCGVKLKYTAFSASASKVELFEKVGNEEIRDYYVFNLGWMF